MHSLSLPLSLFLCVCTRASARTHMHAVLLMIGAELTLYSSVIRQLHLLFKKTI